jgi:hypothetical protein
MKKPVVVRCPTCHKAGEWFATRFGPFCSERCKLVDLGKWFGGENRISEPLRPEHFEKYAELPPGDYLDRPEPAERDDQQEAKN